MGVHSMSSNVKSISVLAAILFTTSMFISGPAQAGHRTLTVTAKKAVSDLPQKRVSYVDLNLTSASGEKTLYRRVSSAVNFVCGVNQSERDLGQLADAAHCTNIAWDGAKPQILTAIGRARNEAANPTHSSLPLAAIMIVAPTGR